MPSSDKYNVMIKVGDLVLKTEKPSIQENTYCRWMTRVKQQTWKCPYQEVFDIGRVYVYLMHGDKAVCYFKDDIENYRQPNPTYKWIEMTADLSMGKVTDP